MEGRFTVGEAKISAYLTPILLHFSYWDPKDYDGLSEIVLPSKEGA